MSNKQILLVSTALPVFFTIFGVTIEVLMYFDLPRFIKVILGMFIIIFSLIKGICVYEKYWHKFDE